MLQQEIIIIIHLIIINIMNYIEKYILSENLNGSSSCDYLVKKSVYLI